jgi:hypothetical protein
MACQARCRPSTIDFLNARSPTAIVFYSNHHIFTRHLTSPLSVLPSASSISTLNTHLIACLPACPLAQHLLSHLALAFTFTVLPSICLVEYPLVTPSVHIPHDQFMCLLVQFSEMLNKMMMLVLCHAAMCGVVSSCPTSACSQS